jgi:hypothetical protein
MRKSTAAALLGLIVIGAAAWAVWRPEIALSQNQAAATVSTATTNGDMSCAGMMEMMMGGSMMGNMHGMGSGTTTNTGDTTNATMGGPMAVGMPIIVPIVVAPMSNLVDMAPTSSSFEAERRLSEIAVTIDRLTQQIEQLAPRANPK